MSLSASTIELAPLPALLAARTTTSALFLLVTVLALLVFFTLVSGKERSEVVAQLSHILPQSVVTSWRGLLEKLHWQLSAHQILRNGLPSSFPFGVSTFAGPLTVVLSRDDVESVTKAPDSRLSLHGFASYIFQFEHTVRGYVLHDNSKENGFLPHLALSGLTKNITGFDPILKPVLAGAWGKEVNAGYSIGEGWTRVNAPSAVRNVIGSTFCRLFFGEELARDAKFFSAAMGFATDVVIAAEGLKFTPAVLKPLVAQILTRRHGNQRYLCERLCPIVDRYRQEQDSLDSSIKEAGIGNVMQSIVSSAKRNQAFSTDKIVSIIMCLWLGSIHQPVMSSIQLFYDLCQHPQYLDALQAEARAAVQTPEECDIASELPLLDSFIKESNRVSPGESISVRRKVIAPFALPSGTQLGPGDAVIVAMQNITQDEENYADARTFKGFRFAPGQAECVKASRFADIDHTYLLWGAGKHGCPGRYIASHIIKLAFTELLREYDFRLKDPSARRHFTWGTATAPLPGVKMLMRAKSN